ncbi:MAG: cupredoxin domain-containing protein [Actinomycetota bacterium]
MRLGRVLAVCLLLAASACSPEAPDEVSVNIRFSRYHPERFEFPAGSTVKFVVINKDPIDHEFLIGDERVQQIHEEGTEAHHGDKPGEISIAAGTTRATTYTFNEPGTLIVGCHLPGHYAFGMSGEIEVG